MMQQARRCSLRPETEPKPPMTLRQTIELKWPTLAALPLLAVATWFG